MSAPVLRFGSAGVGAKVDLSRLIASRMLVQANSGGGKSRALRSLLEETHGTVQQLVLDPEGEFATLRERFDYVLAAKQGGDVQASPRTAKLLCRRLIELGASAVMDLYELPLYERREFVKLFLGELMSLPRTLWRPVLVVIDEAHVFAPERGAGESQATEAVIGLCTQGRKRGFCAVLATQRISKLHKDAAAELLNKMIGRTGLDVDVERAARELGFDKERRQQLPRLAPGEFFVYGPAISNTVTLVRTGDVKTTHPEAGAAGSVAPAPPEKIKRWLAKLVDLPKEAEAEARSLAELRQENATLKAKVTRLQREGPARTIETKVIDQAAIERAVADVRKQHETHSRNSLAKLSRINGLAEALVSGIHELDAFLGTQDPNAPISPKAPITPAHRPEARPHAVSRTPVEAMNGALPKGERAVLIAIASYPGGVARDQLSVLTGYKRSSRDAYVSRALGRGHVEMRGDRIVATDEGIAALGDTFEPLPAGEALQEYWRSRLPDGERKVLEVLLEAYPDAASRARIDDATGYKRSSRDAYISRLKARRLLTLAGSDVRASDTLFEMNP